jgi:hypothetical protein
VGAAHLAVTDAHACSRASVRSCVGTSSNHGGTNVDGVRDAVDESHDGGGLERSWTMMGDGLEV